MTHWSERKARRYSVLMPYEDIETSRFKYLKDIMTQRYVGAEFKQPHLHLVASHRQSCFIAHRKDESAIFYDMYQSAILSKLAGQIASETDSYIDVANTIKYCCGLHIQQKDPKRSKLIEESQLLHSEHYFQIDKPTQEKHKRNFESVKQALRQEEVPFIIQQLLLSHECYHYIIHRDLEPSSRKDALYLFDFALGQVCYENELDFGHIAMYNGNLTSFSPQKIEQIREDLKERRRYYECNKAHLIEEIDCDIFAFGVILDFKLAMSSYTFDFEELLTFCINYYIIYCLLDFHIAMNKRAMLSVHKAIDDNTPPDIADMNLRKVATIKQMFDVVFYKCFDADLTTHDKYEKDLEAYSNRIFDVKMAMDFLYVMPITNVTKEYLMTLCKRLSLNG